MRVFLGIILYTVTVASSALPAPDEFSQAEQEGERNEQRTVDGSAYVRGMVRWLGPALTDSITACKDKSKDAAHPAKLVVQLNLDGTVRKAMIRPSTPYWECVKDSLVKKTFPAPPRDGFWTSGTIG